MSIKNHPYQLVDPSPWPLFVSFALFVASIVGVLFIHEYIPTYALVISLVFVVALAFLWWFDVMRERKDHTPEVIKGMQIGMSMLILSEILFFVVFFWSFFDSWIGSKTGFSILTSDWELLKLTWPPGDVALMDPWGIPWVNTLILLLSGTSVTWAHSAVLYGTRKDVLVSLSITVVLGVIFTAMQVFEYSHATFSFREEGFASLYSSNFYMLTGFHGFHVVVGTIFLMVCLYRSYIGSIDKDNHLSLELAAWYWHFVDVVWLFLFVFVYCLAS